MEISVRGRRLAVSEPLRAYAERRLRFAIGSLGSRVGGIDVRVEDVNGPRGGLDKLCVIAAVLQPMGRIVARASDANAYSAVDRAASRIRSILVRHLRRGREPRRRRRVRLA